MMPSNPSRTIWCRAGLFLFAAAAPNCGLQGQDTPAISGGMTRTGSMDIVNTVHAEVDLGEFIVPVRLGDSNSTITIFTRLYATVRVNEQDKFLDVLESRQARFREKVIVSLRGVTRDELYERNLKKVKQRIYEAMVEAIDSPTIYRAGFISFYYSEE